MTMRYVLLAALAGGCAVCVPVLAQDYPVKSIRYVVPFSPGGPTDTQSRWAAQRLNAAFGQPVIIENRPGAGGVPGTLAGAKSPADGYTLIAANPGPLTVAPAIMDNLPYDTLKDFAPITVVARSASCISVHPSLPVKSVRDFVNLAKAAPGRINYGTPGVGTVGHLTVEYFSTQNGIKLTHVPYKGGVNQFTVDLMSGYIEVAFLQVFTALPLVREGKLRALGVTSAVRSEVLPEVPTVSEQGVPKFESYNWNGILAPAKTPPAIIARIQSVIAAGLKEGRETFTRQGQDPGGDSPAQFAEFLRSEQERFAKIAKGENIARQNYGSVR